MADLGKLKQVRNGHRLHALSLLKKADDLPKGDKALEQMKILLATLKKKAEVLEKCDAEILDALTTDAEIADEIENSMDHNDKMVTAITKVEIAVQYDVDKLKADPPKVVKSEPSESDSDTKETKIQMKLPSLQVGEYNGSLLTWSLFWDKFDVAIHSRKDLSDIQKYTYLKSYLVGEAKNAILGVSYDKDNYEKAIEVLKSRFGNKQLRISAHMKELQNVQGVQNIGDVSGLRRMYDCLETNITSLKVLSVDVSTYGSLLISIIYERIPKDLQIKISLKNWRPRLEFGYCDGSI